MRRNVKTDDAVAGRMPSCRCDDGLDTCACGIKIRKRGEKRCRRCQLQDHEGERIGKLLVVRILRYGMAECRCDCGAVVVRKWGWIEMHKGDPLLSCGCAQRVLVPKVDPMSTFVAIYRSQCRRVSKEWALSDDEAMRLFRGNCFYCGRPPSRPLRVGDETCEKRNGIDRVDSRLGYISGNCVSCCTDCNRIKYTMTVGQLAEMVTKIETRTRRGRHGRV